MENEIGGIYRSFKQLPISEIPTSLNLIEAIYNWTYDPEETKARQKDLRYTLYKDIAEKFKGDLRKVYIKHKNKKERLFLGDVKDFETVYLQNCKDLISRYQRDVPLGKRRTVSNIDSDFHDRVYEK
ncbi:MAG: hypothetical protein ABIB71_02360 [Candidatus Woesearchaeota archaeon]